MLPLIFFCLALLVNSAVCLECGKSMHSKNAQLTHRIVGGNFAEIGEFPWQVTIQRKSQGWQPKWTHFCGGSIINENWILTAAHCVESMKWSYTPGTIRALAGTTDWRNSAYEKGTQVLPIARVVVHQGWDRATGTNDIALLQTGVPIQFSVGEGRILVNKVCLPTNDMANREYSGSALSSGWGYLDKNTKVSPDNLRKVEIPIVDYMTCKNAFAKVIAVTPNQVCAGVASKGNCMGDSGGPLVQAQNDKATQIGIVSFSIPCAVHGYPDVFTKVSRYLDWIAQNTGIAG